MTWIGWFMCIQGSHFYVSRTNQTLLGKFWEQFLGYLAFFKIDFVIFVLEILYSKLSMCFLDSPNMYVFWICVNS